MAIFNSGDDAPVSKDNNTSIITTGAKFSGELNLSCSLFVDGSIEGAVISTNDVSIGKSGRIKGDVKAQRIIIGGRIEGTVDAQRIEIHAGGSVEGTLISSELVIEAKGQFVGESRIKDKVAAEKKVKA